MSSKISFLAFVMTFCLTGALSQRTNGSCIASTGPIENCSQFIYSDCQNATYIIDSQAFSDTCSPVSLFWDAPQYNMTIFFQSPISSTSYSLCLQPTMCVKTYRTTDDGHEVIVDWNTFNNNNNEPVCFPATSKTVSAMKFRFDAGERWHCYGTFIRYFYRF